MTGRLRVPAPWGGNGCDVTMIHCIPEAGGGPPPPFDDAGHPPGCPAHRPAPGGPGCNPSMVHYFGPPTGPLARMFDAAGHPLNCPAHRRESREPATPALPAGGPCLACTHADDVTYCGGPGDGPCRYPGNPPGTRWPAPAESRGPGKSREPAAPVTETPEARARRLDREADDLRRSYAAKLQAADAAWREVGGRP